LVKDHTTFEALDKVGILIGYNTYEIKKNDFKMKSYLETRA
jgi:hypothetical protein